MSAVDPVALVYLAALFASLLLFAAYPLGIAEDYPNHLAAYSVALSGQPQAFYESDWRVMPHLGMSVIALPLLLGVPLEWAGAFYVCLALFSFAAGLLFLHWTLARRCNQLILLALPALFGFSTYMGFLDNMMSLGIAFFACGVFLEDPRTRHPLRMLLLASLTAAAFLVHVMGVLVIAATVLTTLLPRALQAGGLYAAAKVFFKPLLWAWPGLLLVAAWLLTGEQATLPAETVTEERYLIRLVRVVVSIFAFGRDAGSLSLVLMALAIFSSALGLLLGSVKPHKPLMAAGLLFLGFALIGPSRYSAVILDMRMGLAGFALCLASLLGPVGGHRAKLRPGAVLCAIALASVLLLQAVSVVPRLQQSNASQQQLRAALAELPPGARVLGIYEREGRSLFHSGAFVVSDCDGFYPALFEITQPVKIRPAFKELAVFEKIQTPERLQRLEAAADGCLDDGRGGRVCSADWRREFDYLIFFGDRPPPLSRTRLEEVAAGPLFWLFKTR